MVESHALAGKISFANIIRSLNDTSATPLIIFQAVGNFFAIQPTQEMIHGVDAYRFSVILTRLKRSILPTDLYMELIGLAKSFLIDKSAIVPYVFEEWRRAIARSGLESEIEFTDWIPILNNFADYGFRYPSEFAHASRADLAVIISDDITAPEIWKLWRFDDK